MRLLLPLLLTGCNLFAGAPSSDDMGPGIPDTAHADANVSKPDMRQTPTLDMGEQMRDAMGDIGNQDGDASIDDVRDFGLDADAADADANDMSEDMAIDMAPPDPCARPDTLFCSGFEDSAFGDWDGTYEFMCGLTFETTIVRSGVGALKAEMLQGAGNCAAFKAGLVPPVSDDDDIWIRAWMYLPSSTLQLDYFEWIGLYNENSDEEVNAGIWDAGLDGHFHLDSYDGYPQGNFSLPRDQWVCLEWNIQFDAQAGRSVVAVDGVTRVDVGALQLAVLEPLDTFDIGQVYSDQGQTGPVYFDDVFIGRTRPGCD